MMLHSSREPIWDQTHDVELPALDAGAFLRYLEQNFELARRGSAFGEWLRWQNPLSLLPVSK